jgi:agmatine deiminase
MADALTADLPPPLWMPAEWESHAATWIGWPANVTDWPGKFAPIPWVFSEIAKKITAGEMLYVLVNSPAHERRARAVLRKTGVDLSSVRFFRFPANRGWTRDSGPWFVRHRLDDGSLRILRFRFSAWEKYPDWKKDDAVPERAAKSLGFPVVRARHNRRDVILEGGSVDVNGRGTLVTTEECLLHPTTQVRNPGFTREDYHDVFRRYLGVNNVLWLGRGIAGDDTHGHVDDLCRFVNPTTVVLCQEGDPRDDNYVPLRENWERLEGARLEDGSRLTVVGLPMPTPLLFDGVRVPASYANFYICNAAVLVPTFNDPRDRLALGILADLLPGRPVIGIHAVDLVWGLGTLHCLTQQQPGPDNLS